MTKKLPTGITQLPNGRWRVRPTATDPMTGRLAERDRILPSGASLADAVKECERLRDEIRTGGRQTTDDDPTLGEYAQSWLQRKVARLRSDNTKQRYGEALELHILPELGKYKVRMLDSEILEDFLLAPRNRHELHEAARNAKRKANGLDPLPPRAPEPYSAETVNGWWRVLKSCLRDAVAKYRLEIDPTKGVKPLALDDDLGDEDTTNTLEPEELAGMLVVCQTKYRQWYA